MNIRKTRLFLNARTLLLTQLIGVSFYCFLSKAAADTLDGKSVPRLALTFEGLPGVGAFERHPYASIEKLANSLRVHLTPYPVIFVSGGKLEKHEAGMKALEFWAKKEYSAFSLTWSGRPMTEIPENEMIEEVQKNQNWVAEFRYLGKDRGFRFPEMKVESGTKKRRELVKHLNRKQYKVIPVTLALQDGPFCEAYDQIPEKDAVRKTNLRKLYLEYIQAAFDYWLPIHRRYFRGNPPWILSFKLCDLNAEFMDEFLTWSKSRGHQTEGARDSIKHTFYKKDLPRYITPDSRSVLESFGRQKLKGYETSDDPQLTSAFETIWAPKIKRVVNPPPTPVGRTID